jgi:Type II secretion system (T2SS), protein K
MGSDHSAREDPDVRTTGQRSSDTGQKGESAGAAILLALWALFLLSALIISWALDINSRLAVSSEGTRMLRAEAVACSGAEVALNPTTKPGSPNLNGQLNKGATYQARITGEGGRIDLNWVVMPQNIDILRNYLENKGIDLNERDLMIDALQDWIEPNTGLHRLNAPPESENYHPAHAPLARVDEVKKVAGWAEFTSVPGWDDDFTVNTQQGIDVSWASHDVLLALPGMTEDLVGRFLQIRQGPDGIDGTEDDTQITSIDDVRTMLGLNELQFKQIQPLLSPSIPVPVYRVVSIGTAGNAKRTVQLIFRRVGVMPQVITWKEF